MGIEAGNAGFDRRGVLKMMGAAGGLFAAGGLLTACGDDESEARGEGNFKGLKLGYAIPLTGPAASTFSVIFKPADIALEELKSNGSAVTFEKVEGDDKADPSVEPGVFRKFKQSGVDFVVGPNTSGTALAALPIATSLKILNLGSAVANDLGDPSKGPYCWQFNGSAQQEATKVIEFALEQGWNKIAMMYADDAFGDALSAASEEVMADKGVTFLAVQQHASDETNLAPYVSKLRDSGADTILIWSSLAPTIAATVKAFDNANYTPNILGHCSWLSQTTYDAGSSAVTDNIYGYFNRKFTWSDSEDIGQEQLDYADKLDAATKDFNLGGQESVTITTPSYDFVHILARTIEEAGTTDPVEVSKAMEGLGSVEGVTANYKFSAESHSVLDPDSMVMAKLSSLGDPKARRWFRERA